jgi:phosphoribosyl-dephospho-CoA transferase
MFSRHDLVWLTGRGWDAALESAPPGQHEALEQWRRQDWPAVVRRADIGLAAGQVSLGISLPPTPAGVKGRIALNAAESDVANHRPAIALADAAQSAPGHWRPALNDLAASLPLQAYGSLAMQSITGQTYLTPSSDIDLLFFPADANALDEGLVLLERHAVTLPLDGEIVFPSGAAVAWKEWLIASRNEARVLVKDIDAVRLAPRAELIASLA